ncbi:hypothetical protein PSN45_003055 [Yamadazyma tenuis]|uniref:DUF7907 domain-containing protein n=1 Tax=Candida tenuis (strain ATCC 10573 / BCRC 21748 / CBS 615 / JCM 9827 / NBRC 10315 / NRRL Y-1498 / VKM Y-70) TaxID=590646 RepID=G3AXC2_CANTC|nr:uncharacterized protein CANTEDRAFT_112083 [Yamadazyma tenuis ATCC 10573]XP_006683992.1 uncharacterized protein CANTEDRAFT_112083 [Yamadazyma tenuis ATCC 10573]EGV66733.1 hypothetical protein CANTEDRAFT_112083 [Yamadazyma tenuis ATCC 10573]EGV66734.1 hypothetical protein CANTEDRAFT_112083 [Yamadazyma tenuis ATCC 10573]WEJ95535.1 hypothetical protein PSN45_003055 [Yamadazyma tenuis]
MKFSIVFASAAALMTVANAAPTPESTSVQKRSDPIVHLFVESEDSSVSGQGLSPLHEGAALDYVFLGKNSADFHYNSTSHSIYSLDGNLELVPVVESNIVEFVPGKPNVFVKDGYLSYKGSSSFAACNNVNQQYDYKGYALAQYPNENVPRGCINVKVKAVIA